MNNEGSPMRAETRLKICRQGCSRALVSRQLMCEVVETRNRPLHGKTLQFSGDFRLRIQDSENGWETEFHISFSFPAAAPKSGSGSLTFTKPPHMILDGK